MPIGRHVAESDITTYGDSGLLVRLRGATAEDQWATAHALARSLLATPPTGFVDVVASFRDVFIAFDPLLTDHAQLQRAVERLLTTPASAVESRTFTVPVVYGGTHGPDLQSVADQLGLTPAQTIDLHTATPWTVRLRAAPVGAPMMDGPDFPRAVSRLPEPRVRMSPGSVGVSGHQTVIYPSPSPGGWRIIGRTPIRLFDLNAEPMVLHQPGDRLRFVPIPPQEWDDWAGRRLSEDLVQAGALPA